MGVKEIKPEDFKINPFTTYSNKWTLITAEKEGIVNTMTASWGELGYVWGKNSIVAYIRPQRYTKEFVDSSDFFSVTVFPEKYHDKLYYLGRVSGKDGNKIEKAGLTVTYEDGVPYFKEAELTIIGRKLYAEELKGDAFTDVELKNKVYPQKDYHTLYVGEVTKILVKDE